MSKLSEFIKWFVYITVGVVMVCAINVALSDIKYIPAEMLWQILVSALATSAVTTFIGPDVEKEVKKVWYQYILHFVSLCVVMIGIGIWCHWINANTKGILLMILSVIFVYGVSMLIEYMVGMKQSKSINEKLKEMYKDN